MRLFSIRNEAAVQMLLSNCQTHEAKINLFLQHHLIIKHEQTFFTYPRNFKTG